MVSVLGRQKWHHEVKRMRHGKGTYERKARGKEGDEEWEAKIEMALPHLSSPPASWRSRTCFSIVPGSVLSADLPVAECAVQRKPSVMLFDIYEVLHKGKKSLSGQMH